MDHNHIVSSNRVKVENYYGRMKLKFAIMREKFRAQKIDYPKYFRFCSCLTNYHLSRHPLRANDENFYRNLVENQIRIAREVWELRNQRQRNYRQGRRARILEGNH